MNMSIFFLLWNLLVFPCVQACKCLHTWKQLGGCNFLRACQWPPLVGALSTGGGGDTFCPSPEAPVGRWLHPAAASLSLPRPGQRPDLRLQPCIPEAFLQGTHTQRALISHCWDCPCNVTSVHMQGHAGMSRGSGPGGPGQLHLS